jgi:hypothetical protein
MGAYTYQDLDFVFRTQQLLKQYHTIKKNNPFSKNYNITLFLNCFVGLLIIPQQHSIQCIPENELKKGIRKYGINPDDILVIKKKDKKNKGQLLDEIKSFKNVAKHIRNSIAHNNFKVLSTLEKIDRIEFKDYLGEIDKDDPEKNLTFNLTITINNLFFYSLMISAKFLNAMAKDIEPRFKNFKQFKNRDLKHKQLYQDIHDIHIH